MNVVVLWCIVIVVHGVFKSGNGFRDSGSNRAEGIGYESQTEKDDWTTHASGSYDAAFLTPPIVTDVTATSRDKASGNFVIPSYEKSQNEVFNGQEDKNITSTFETIDTSTLQDKDNQNEVSKDVALISSTDSISEGTDPSTNYMISTRNRKQAGEITVVNSVDDNMSYTTNTEINSESNTLADGSSSTREPEDASSSVSTSASTSSDTSSTYEVIESSSKPSTSDDDFFARNACPEDQIPTVSFTNSTILSSSITLYWDAPNKTECVNGYVIYWDGKEFNTSDLSYTLEDLEPCTTYTVGIAVQSGTVSGQRSQESFTTTTPGGFTDYVGVLNITVNMVSSNSLNITWLVPSDDKLLRCVTSYSISWWNAVNKDSLGAAVADANETSHLVPVIGCMSYGMQVIPNAGQAHQGQGNVLENYTVNAIPFSNIRKVFSDPGRTEVNITWQTDNATTNACPATGIFVSCNATADNNAESSWIVRHRDSSKNITEQTPDFRYTITIDQLSPFTDYTCVGIISNTGGNSPEYSFDLQTDEDVTSEPTSLRTTDVQSTSFLIEWSKPDKIPGIIKYYDLVIDNSGPQHKVSDECSYNFTKQHYLQLPAESTYYNFDIAMPFYEYHISLYAVDGGGNGSVASTTVITQSVKPDKVENLGNQPPVYSENETYYAEVTVEFDPPCNMNGAFKYYQVISNGTRSGFDTTIDGFNTTETFAKVTLLPERSYFISVLVVTENFTSEPVTEEITSKSGVPPLGPANMSAPKVTDHTKAVFTLPKDAFSNENGEIVAYALILLTSNQENSSYGFWDETNWPAIPPNSLQLTPNFWNPFLQDTATSSVFTIGTNSSCSDSCNKPLSENTKYWLVVRALTGAAYKDSALLAFHTVSEMPLGNDLGLILGLTFGIFGLLVAVIIFLIILWRRKRRSIITEEEKRVSTAVTTTVPPEKFSAYYASTKENYSVIKEQFTDLGVLSKEVAGEITFANLPENRRKNRYTNILPYDATRVSLKIDEDDDLSSDYINASYIKGFSGKVEYIATQGPLESTARDFWKMILQENVSIIVMVSQFIEQSKEKCHHYFPNNHESLYFGESLEVKCTTELHFGTYCVRTLQVRKGQEQRDLYHMQFLEWPDFGVPQGTENMLQFCGQIREKAVKEGGVIVVHCSAGVGRTGTLIALDILLQTIDHHRDINIYKTVFDLRKQRTNMVQTEKQYVFIHTCIKDYIETPTIQSHDTTEERLYENMEVLKSSLKKNLIQEERESAL